MTKWVYGQNHIDFKKSSFPKFRHFDWVIAKLVLIFSQSNCSNFGTQVLQNQLTDYVHYPKGNSI